MLVESGEAAQPIADDFSGRTTIDGPMADEVKNYITPGGFRRLQEELARLWKVERPPVVATVTWAAHLRYLDINLMHALIPGISVAYS